MPLLCRQALIEKNRTTYYQLGTLAFLYFIFSY